MTQEQWLACTNPQKMLAFLQGKVSDRKLRLFAVACCRLVWHRIDDWGSWAAVESAEQYADGQISLGEMTAAASEAWHELAQQVCLSEAGRAASTTALYAAGWATDSRKPPPEWVKQAAALRDIVGNPFHPIALANLWKQWQDGLVVRLAQSLYEERAFDLLPILADALEEAGCDNAEILDHLRRPGPHARGCWVLDLLLGKS
jgi:hypothetical protein